MYPENIPTLHLTIDEIVEKCQLIHDQLLWHRAVYGNKGIVPRSYISYHFTVLAERMRQKGWHTNGTFYRSFITTQEDYDYMAKQANTFLQYEQTNYRLSEEQLASLDAYGKRVGNSVEKLLEQIVGDGYKVSLTYMFDNNAFIFTITTTDNITHTSKSFVSNWASTVYDAVLIGHYKLYVVWDGGQWFEKQNSFLG